MSSIKIGWTAKQVSKFTISILTGAGYRDTLFPSSWTTCGVMGMSRIFQIVDLSQCHTTVITKRISGCNAKVTELHLQLYNRGQDNSIG